MAKVIINAKKCKGCGLCVEFCPAKIIVMSLTMNPHGTNTAIVKNMSKCRGCAFCAIVCPDWAIEVRK